MIDSLSPPDHGTHQIHQGERQLLSAPGSRQAHTPTPLTNRTHPLPLPSHRLHHSSNPQPLNPTLPPHPARRPNSPENPLHQLTPTLNTLPPKSNSSSCQPQDSQTPSDTKTPPKPNTTAYSPMRTFAEVLQEVVIQSLPTYKATILPPWDNTPATVAAVFSANQNLNVLIHGNLKEGWTITPTNQTSASILEEFDSSMISTTRIPQANRNPASPKTNPNVTTRDPTRCYRCQRFGHTQKNCSSRKHGAAYAPILT